MKFENPDQLSLSGSLLLADPALLDSNFKRSVLILCQHSAEDGAQGYILNKPIGKTVGEVTQLPGYDQLAEIPVYLGGPVGTDQLTFASMAWSDDDEEFRFDRQISAQEAISRLKEGFIIRAFVGHAGWAAGQLEGELKEQAWITQRPSMNVLESQEDSLWEDTLRSMSPWHQLLAMTPEDPSLN